MTPEQFINTVRRTFGRYPDYSGGCMKFHILLCAAFPEGQGYYNSEHVITLIDGKYWDIDGEVKNPDLEKFTPILDGWSGRFLVRSFNGMLAQHEIEFLLTKYG